MHIIPKRLLAFMLAALMALPAAIHFSDATIYASTPIGAAHPPPTSESNPYVTGGRIVVADEEIQIQVERWLSQQDISLEGTTNAEYPIIMINRELYVVPPDGVVWVEPLSALDESVIQEVDMQQVEVHPVVVDDVEISVPSIDQPDLTGYVFLHEFLPFQDHTGLGVRLRAIIPQITYDYFTERGVPVGAHTQVVPNSEWGIVDDGDGYGGAPYRMIIHNLPPADQGFWQGNSGGVHFGQYSAIFNDVSIQLFCIHPWRPGPTAAQRGSVQPGGDAEFIRNGWPWNIYAGFAEEDSADTIARTRLMAAIRGAEMMGLSWEWDHQNMGYYDSAAANMATELAGGGGEFRASYHIHIDGEHTSTFTRELGPGEDRIDFTITGPSSRPSGITDFNPVEIEIIYGEGQFTTNIPTGRAMSNPGDVFIERTDPSLTRAEIRIRSVFYGNGGSFMVSGGDVNQDLVAWLPEFEYTIVIYFEPPDPEYCPDEYVDLAVQISEQNRAAAIAASPVGQATFAGLGSSLHPDFPDYVPCQPRLYEPVPEPPTGDCTPRMEEACGFWDCYEFERGDYEEEEGDTGLQFEESTDLRWNNIAFAFAETHMATSGFNNDGPSSPAASINLTRTSEVFQSMAG